MSIQNLNVREKITGSGITVTYGNGIIGNCVGRGISIMRKALGYKSKMPKWYIPGGTDMLHMCSLLSRFFKNRKIYIWCNKEYWKHHKNLRYCGEPYAHYPRDPNKAINPNTSIHAFVYHCGGFSGHFVVGNPSGSLDNKMLIVFVAAVSIKKIGGGE